MAAKHLIVAIHGIMTRQSTRSWVDDFAHFVWLHYRSIAVTKREYWAGPLPTLNCLFRNRWHAKGLVAEVTSFLDDGAELSFIAHSNGADIALRTVKALAALGYRTRALVLAGAAIQSDVVRNGIMDLITDGELGLAVANCSKDDTVLALPCIWPYGRLGREGWTVQGFSAASGPFVREHWWPGCSHSGYYEAERRDSFYQTAVHDCCFAPVHPAYAQHTETARRNIIPMEVV